MDKINKRIQSLFFSALFLQPFCFLNQAWAVPTPQGSVPTAIPEALRQKNQQLKQRPKQKPSQRHQRSSIPQDGAWYLEKFQKIAKDDPRRFFRLAHQLFSEARWKRAQSDARLAFDWQHRWSVIQSLNIYIDAPRAESDPEKRRYFLESMRILEKALLQDPSLLVRDGAAEFIRRQIHLFPVTWTYWKPRFEKAFLDSQNILSGEGLFVRETLLKAFAETKTKPSEQVLLAARQDRNSSVQKIAAQWQ